MTTDDVVADPPQSEAAVTLRAFSSPLVDNDTMPTWLDRLSRATREAPIQSLMVAFLIGVMLARR
ncbi:hypothetical protein IC762_30430 [Bradyrhizobium genosp. L]|uniref:hypothetical protein n=1 Tax=Bradyrhizobium genosp. L TaxID=83637 RepID=UPI0018A29A00|nr:hypothetical protein [Bradyrhizobium genosp. L]QPF83929.1 hypothetical protein IC762_30430 [Bradyrhizobium genosp. L]